MEEMNVVQEVQKVLNVMNQKHPGSTQVMTWGEMKEKFPKCIKMTSLFMESIEKGDTDEDFQDDWSFEMSDIFIDSLHRFEEADSAMIMSKYFKCLINVFIDAVGDMYAAENGFDEVVAEGIKLEAHGRFSNFYQNIDRVAEKIFDVA